MKKSPESKMSLNKKVIIPAIGVGVIVVSTISGIMIAKAVRNNKIDKQIKESLADGASIARIYCNGNGILLSKSTYANLVENNIDLMIKTKDCIAVIGSDKLTQKITINTETIPIENGLFVKSENNLVKELYVDASSLGREYLSEFAGKGSEEFFVSNIIKVGEDGYAPIELQEGADRYSLLYVVPTELNIEDVNINSGLTKPISFGIGKEAYTYNTIQVECSDPSAIEITETGDIKYVKAGEFKMIYKTDSQNYEANCIVNQSAEKIELNKTTVNVVIDGNVKIDALVLPDNAISKDLVWTSSDEGIATVDESGNIHGVAIGNCKVHVETIQEPKVARDIDVEVSEKKTAYPLSNGQSNASGGTYINGVLLVNKTHPISENYAPGMDPVTYQAYLNLQAAARDAGYSMPLLSGYRSYETQKGLYWRYVDQYGQAAADTFSARPGTSEHQTGLAMDVGDIDDSYGDTPAGKWLAQNCHKYGFIIRYPKGKDSITGYKYEPWHIRYLGEDLATKVYNSGLTLEEYLGAI